MTITELEDAGLETRLTLAAGHIDADKRDTMSDAQQLHLYETRTRDDAVRLLVAQLALALTGLRHAEAVPPAERWGFAAFAALQQMDGAPELESLLSEFDHADATWLSTGLEMAGTPQASPHHVRWYLTIAIVSGWPGQEIDISRPLGLWNLGPADALFQTLLNTVTLTAWGYLPNQTQ